MKAIKILMASAVVASMAAGCNSAPKSITVEKDGYTTQSNVSVTVADKALLKEVELIAA